jgi:phage repressor protein C with HTH and peptisase S24 domain
MHHAYMTENQDDQARRLREARAAAGYANPTDAARAMGVQVPTYLGHENASRGFKGGAGRYADFFKVNLEWLLLGRGTMRRGSDGTVSANNTAQIAEEPLTERVINIHQFPRDIPILGSGACGEDGLFEFNGQTLDHARRPARLQNVRDAYAIYVSGLSMSPWREPGQLVYVHPHQPVKIGDYVVVQLHPERAGEPPKAYIKRLVRRTAKDLRLLQYEPREEKTVAMAKVKAIHRVIDWDELLGL